MLELLEKRYSSRHYSPEKVSDKALHYILKCMLMSPSGKNKNPWEFILVTDINLIQELALSKTGGADFLQDTQALIVAIGHEALSDTWIEDTAITLTIGHLAASHLNLGSCWIQSRNRHNPQMSSEVFIKNLLNIPDKLRVLGMLSLGHALDHKVKTKPLQVTKVSLDTYKAPYDFLV